MKKETIKNIVMTILVILILVGNIIILRTFLIKDLEINNAGLLITVVFSEIIIFIFWSLIYFKERRKEIIIMIITLIILDFFLSIIIPETYQIQNKYGWGWTQEGQVNLTVQDNSNETRNITVNYYENGFKRWGNTSTNKTKLMIIGDSFTEMIYVSNGEEWYSYLEKNFTNTEFFVHGLIGAGSLQEYMVLDDNIDKIKPDIILLQFCTNDYLNNLYKLELKSYPSNNHAYRPYLENEKINYRLGVIYPNLRTYSTISDKLLAIYDSYLLNVLRLNRSAFETAQIYKEDKKALAETMNITLKIINMIKKRAYNKPIYLFCACGYMEESISYLCKETNITCIKGVYEYVKEKEKSGSEVYVINDGHWNKLGNELAGKFLVNYFNKNKIL